MASVTAAAGSDDTQGQAILARWYASDGQCVEIDQLICELETDKASVNVAAPSAGILRHVKRAGETVRIGEEIGSIDPP